MIDLGYYFNKNEKFKEQTPQNSKKQKTKHNNSKKNKPYNNQTNKYHKNNPNESKDFPYKFIKRNTPKRKLDNFHDKLNRENFDVVFEVDFTSETPVAVNPCEQMESELKPPKIEGEEIGGFYKRWLTIDNKLVISSFTIKGAIESAYANCFGGCYRVNDSKIVAHPEKKKEGDYPYQGKYKRYKVDRNKSKPAIIKEITENDDSSKSLTIQPVEEFYFDNETLPSNLAINKGDGFFVSYYEKYHKKIIDSISLMENSKHHTSVKYYGKYKFGMNLSLSGGDLDKRHYHRFYKEKGRELQITVSELYFEKLEKLKKKVYMGFFKPLSYKDPRRNLTNEPWYDDLRNLQAGDWIYYNDIAGNIVGIGRNYQFKAIFAHEEAVPKEQRACNDINNLCPRCSLFGLTYNEKDNKNKAYKGRVYTSNFVNNITLKKVKGNFSEKISGISCPIYRWVDNNGNETARQFLLPIFGAPKPNKRDVNGYFDQKGNIQGTKIYKDAQITYKNLKNEINMIIQDTIKWQKKDLNGENYSHKLRNFAQVAREGLTFSGTIAIDNASKEEVENMLSLLKGCFFKVGLGKSMGLGRIRSKITKIWIRTPDDYDKWSQFVSIDEFKKFGNFKEQHKHVKDEYKNLYPKQLRYPSVKEYWEKARNFKHKKYKKQKKH